MGLNPQELSSENGVDCPFKVTMELEAPLDGNSGMPRLDISEDGIERRVVKQISPFKPAGHFKTRDSLEVYYSIEPQEKWFHMKRYGSFILNHTNYSVDDYVCVANELTVERQNSQPSVGSNGNAKEPEYWVAKILEIRASDEFHVYARIYWMYWPEELPPGTVDGINRVKGRQPYHGQDELIASIHMDVINVTSIFQSMEIVQWNESDDLQELPQRLPQESQEMREMREMRESLYWRQTFHYNTLELSSINLVCECSTPANPDEMLIGCNKSNCGEWMHYHCLLDNVLERVYLQLGTHTPRMVDDSSVNVEETEKNPLGPEIRDEEDSNKRPLFVTGEKRKQTLITQDDMTPGIAIVQTKAQLIVGASGLMPAKRRRRRRKAESKKPWEGLFEATLRLDKAPTIWNMKDLREGVRGGEKEWDEPVYCLLCGAVID